MTKKFVPVQCKKKVYRVFQEDIKKIYYMNRAVRPSVPKFQENNEVDEEI